MIRNKLKAHLNNFKSLSNLHIKSSRLENNSSIYPEIKTSHKNLYLKVKLNSSCLMNSYTLKIKNLILTFMH